jgi:hypothetical protein
MRHAADAAEHLRDHVDDRDRPSEVAAQRKGEANGRIEMRAGERTEYKDQHRENAAGRQRVA